MGGSSSAPKNTTSTQTQSNPYVDPHIPGYIERARSVSELPYNEYAGDRIAPLTPHHEIGLDMITQRAREGSPVMKAANQNLMGTLRGDYLNSNPYLDNMFGAATRGITSQYEMATRPGTDAAFSRAGAFGGTAHNQAQSENQRQLAAALGDTAANIYGQNYQQERGRQMQANLFAPQAAAADYDDINQLLNVGDIRRENTQDRLNMSYEDFLRRQQYPTQQLDVFGNAISRGLGAGNTTVGTQTNPYRPSRTAGGLGGALSGAALGSMIPGLGTGLGAGAGLLLGLLG